MLILLKIFVTVAVILLLVAVAEFANPRLAGILAGYPIGTAIVLYFYGFEHGVDFASTSAIFCYFPTGLWAVLSYSLTVTYAYPVYGLFLGTLCGFAVATICLLLFNLSTFYSMGLKLARISQKN